MDTNRNPFNLPVQGCNDREINLALLLNDFDISDQMEAKIVTELAGLYYAAGRPVGCLAALLRAKRYNAAFVSEYDIERASKKIQSMDVNRLGDNAHDAYELAVEFENLNADRLTEYFYQLATETDNRMIKAKAAQNLADYYDRNNYKNHSDADEARKFYAIATSCGFPDILSW